jgi:Domain of unknown function (DUF4386)
LNEVIARMRLRGAYALLAGAVLLIGIPLVQSVVLAPTGYINAVNAIIDHQNFGPLLSWAAANPGASRFFRVVEVIPFLLALGVPGPLQTLLRPDDPRGGRVALWLGRVGFALFALALLIGMFTSAAAATSYATTTGASARQAIALDYAGRYALETILSRILGGICLTVYLLAVSLRMVRGHRFPLWFAIIGILCAALEAATALSFAFTPAAATTPTAGFAVVALAIWLVVAGIYMVRAPAPRSPASRGTGATS